MLLRALSDCGSVDLFLILPYRLLTPEQIEEIADHHRLVDHVDWTLNRSAAPWRTLTRLPGRLGATAEHLAEQAGHLSRDPAVATRLASRLARTPYDVVVSRYLVGARRADVLAHRAPLHALDLDDVAPDVLRDRLRSEGRFSWPERARVGQLRRILGRTLARFDHVWLSDAADRERLDAPDATVLPNGVWRPAEASPVELLPSDDRSREIVFVSTLGYEANREGLEHFLAHVWPRVRREVPEARLRVVGTLPRDDPSARWRAVPGVEVSGFVEDLRAVYARAAFTIAPLYWGGGPKIKVLESLAWGRTAVVTPVGHAGFEEVLPHTEAVVRAEDDARFAEACVRLLRDPGERKRLAERGAGVVAERFGFDAFRASVTEAIERLARSGSAADSSPWARRRAP